jgi:hypothetical protein
VIPGAIEVPKSVLSALVDLAEFQRLRKTEVLVRAAKVLRDAEGCRGEASMQRARQRYADALAESQAADDVLIQARGLLRQTSLEDALAHCKQAFAPLMEPLPQAMRDAVLSDPSIEAVSAQRSRS